MAIVQALIAWAGHSLGKVVNSAFSWATLLLFGKVPDDRQLILSIISLTSIVWMVVVLGIFSPHLGTFLLALVPLPNWINPKWISRAMLFFAIVLPFANGLTARFLHDRQERSKGWRYLFLSALNGWRLTLALALTLVVLIVIAPINKIGELAKRWTAEHLPVVIEPESYERVTEELHGMLKAAGVQCHEQRPAKVMQAPVWLLVALTGKMLKRLVADKLIKLVYQDGELEIRPSDLVVRGTEDSVGFVIALLIDQYCFGTAYLSWTKDGNELEDEMRQVFKLIKEKRIPRHTALARADACFGKLKDLGLAKEECETLHRVFLKLKLDILQGVSEAEKKAS